MRLWYLHRFGGVWLDASVVVVRPLWGDAPERGRWSWAWLDGYDPAIELHCFVINPAKYPDVMENSVLAAPEGSGFVADWFAGFDAAVREGVAEYCDRIQAEGRVPEGLPGGVAGLPYLTMHVVGSLLWNARGGVGVRGLPSGSGPFMIQFETDWSSSGTTRRLLQDRTLHERVPLVKLRGEESRMLGEGLEHGHYHPDASVVRQLWGQTPAWIGSRQRRTEHVLLGWLVLLLGLCLLGRWWTTSRPTRGSD